MAITRVYFLFLFLSQWQLILSHDHVPENEPFDSESLHSESLDYEPLQSDSLSDPLQSESLETELIQSDCNEITGCSETVESDDIEIPVQDDSDSYIDPGGESEHSEDWDDIHEEIAATDTVALDEFGVEMYPAEGEAEEKEEMVELELDGIEKDPPTNWVTYYMSIINLSVLLVVFVSAAICVMLIAYTIHKRRNEEKPIDIENENRMQSLHYDAEYSPSELSPLTHVVII